MEGAAAMGSEGVAFIGDVLGPLFYFDPSDERVASTYDAMAALDPVMAAREWPFSASDPSSFEAALQKIGEGLRAGIDDGIVWEYRRLFVGPSAKAAPPWGSVYTDRDQVIFGRATLDLRRWMRESGIEKQGLEGEPEDHIGLMLIMMSWIARSKPGLLDDYLQHHLLTWAPHFLEVMRAETAHPFFEGLALLAEASLEGVREAHGLAVEEPRFYR